MPLASAYNFHLFSYILRPLYPSRDPLIDNFFLFNTFLKQKLNSCCVDVLRSHNLTISEHPSNDAEQVCQFE